MHVDPAMFTCWAGRLAAEEGTPLKPAREKLARILFQASAAAVPWLMGQPPRARSLARGPLPAWRGCDLSGSLRQILLPVSRDEDIWAWQSCRLLSVIVADVFSQHARLGHEIVPTQAFLQALDTAAVVARVRHIIAHGKPTAAERSLVLYMLQVFGKPQVLLGPDEPTGAEISTFEDAWATLAVWCVKRLQTLLEPESLPHGQSSA